MRLTDPLSNTFRLADAHKAALKKLGIITVRDLLYHFPFRYEASGRRGGRGRSNSRHGGEHHWRTRKNGD